MCAWNKGDYFALQQIVNGCIIDTASGYLRISLVMRLPVRIQQVSLNIKKIGADHDG